MWIITEIKIKKYEDLSVSYSKIEEYIFIKNEMFSSYFGKMVFKVDN